MILFVFTVVWGLLMWRFWRWAYRRRIADAMAAASMAVLVIGWVAGILAWWVVLMNSFVMTSIYRDYQRQLR